MAGALWLDHDWGIWLLLFLATITDLRSGKIPNLLTFSFLLVGLAVKYLSQPGLENLSSGLLGVATGFFIFSPLYFATIMAAGDVKLLMAFGAWSSPPDVVKLAGATIIIGAAVGLFQMIKARGLGHSLKNLSAHFKKDTEKTATRMALAPAFFCAFCFLKISEIQGWDF